MRLAQLSLLALGLGVVTGLGAVLFRDLIGLIHNLLFTGHAVIHYDANIFTAPAPWGPLVILVPVLGAVGVTFLVTNFAPEAKGHGVPEVMDAIYYKGGVIRPVVALVKSLASAIAIGSGCIGRAGRADHPDRLGARLDAGADHPHAGGPADRPRRRGRRRGNRLDFQYAHRRRDVRHRADDARGERGDLSSGRDRDRDGDVRGPLVLRRHARLPRAARLQAMPIDSSAWSCCSCSPCWAALTGIAAAGFIRALHLAEDLFDRIRFRYLRHMLGMLILGVLMYLLLRTVGQYYVDGVGYATVQAILAGQISTFWLLGLLFVCKALATSLSLGSGSSGGIFSPSLFMGAALGGGFAALLNTAGLPIHLSVPAFAMVGMGAMVGGGTGAVMTAVTMIFEMTLDYSIVMPMIVAVAMSIGARRVLSRETIYTLKLVRRGRAIPKARHANMFLVRSAREVMDTDIQVLPAEASFDDYLRQPEHAGRLRHVVVTDKGHLYGVIRVNTGLRRGLESANTGVSLGDVASRNFTVVGEDETAFEVIRRMWRKNAIMAVVVRGHGIPRGSDVAGVITKEHVADSVADSVKAYPQ